MTFGEIWNLDFNLDFIRKGIKTEFLMYRYGGFENPLRKELCKTILAYICGLRSLLPMLFNYYIAEEMTKKEKNYNYQKNSMRALTFYRDCVNIGNSSDPQLIQLKSRLKTLLLSNEEKMKGLKDPILKLVFQAYVLQDEIKAVFINIGDIHKDYTDKSFDCPAYADPYPSNELKLEYIDPDFECVMKLQYERVSSSSTRYLDPNIPRIFLLQQDAFNTVERGEISNFISKYPT